MVKKKKHSLIEEKIENLTILDTFKAKTIIK